MRTDKQIQRDNFEDAGFSTEPEPHHRMSCGCGYSGTPDYVLPFSEIEQDGIDLFVCPECGSA